jgi:CHAD domain-containing protein
LRSKPTLPAVARSRRFQQALGRRLRVLDQDLPAALEHDAQALHRTRVASRRLREVLPVIEQSVAALPELHRSRRRQVRHLTRALGGVRELDVALELLDEITSRHHHFNRSAAAVRAEIQRERAARYADMIRSLDEIKPGRLTRELESLGAAGRKASAADQRRLLQRRVLRRAAALERTIDEAGALYAFDRLHLVRIAAKKLRYVLELVQELTRVGTTRLVSRLKQVQDLLGRLHDLEVLAAYVRRVREVPAPRGAGTGSGSHGLIGVIERETRVLHAEYLRRAAMLQAVTASCRQDVGARLR